MATMLPPVKTTYLLQPSRELLYEELAEWISETGFYETELSFLSKITRDAYGKVMDHKNLSDLRDHSEKIEIFRNRLHDLENKMVVHGKALVSLEKHETLTRDTLIFQEHISLVREMKDLAARFRSLKSKIFELVEIQLRKTRMIKKDFDEGRLTL